MDFVRMWEIKELVRVMVHEWGQVVSYQNPLPCQKESLDANPETGERETEKVLCVVKEHIHCTGTIHVNIVNVQCTCVNCKN